MIEFLACISPTFLSQVRANTRHVHFIYIALTHTSTFSFLFEEKFGLDFNVTCYVC
jgi:hypothetical protein